MKKKGIIIISGSEEIQEEVYLEIIHDKINYLENKNTNVLFDKKNKILIRDNMDFYMELLFLENKCHIFFKELKKSVELPIHTKQLNIEENNIEIKYELENLDYCYQIKMEEEK